MRAFRNEDRENCMFLFLGLMTSGQSYRSMIGQNGVKLNGNKVEET